MGKLKRLKACNVGLSLVAAVVLLSSLQMEACGGKGWAGMSFSTLTYIHCVLGGLMLLLVAVHLYIHWGGSKWLNKIKGLKSVPARWLCVLWLLMIVLSVLAFAHWVGSGEHAPLGAVHGKIGFLFLILCFGHLAKRWKWMKTQVFGRGKKR